MPRVFDDLELGLLQEVLDSGDLGGWGAASKVVEFEQKFAAKVGADSAVAMSSAMSGLHVAVMAAGVGPGSEVICDPIVQFGGVATMHHNGVPVFADVDPETYCIDPDSVQARITEHTRAIVCTNLWGLPCNLSRLREIADEHGLVLIEDCAHCLTSTHQRRDCGTWGDMGVFSFQMGKQLPTGDGGMLVTSRDDLLARIKTDWLFGESPAELAWNYRMSQLQAAVGLGQLTRVDDYIAEACENQRLYDEAVRDVVWLRNRRVPDGDFQAGYIFACAFEGDGHGIEYDDFKRACEESGVSIRFGFTLKPAYQYEVFRQPIAYANRGCPTRCPLYQGELHYEDGWCPNAEDLIPRLITISVLAQEESLTRHNADKLLEAIALVEG